jgi:DNA-binding MarR family transcriptional regulator
VYQFGMAERQLITQYKQAGGSLSPGRVRALNVLLREEEATPGALAREAGLRPNSITVMLEQLERSGVVKRRRDESDRRVWWVSLTSKGRAELAKLQREWDKEFADAFADTPPEHLEIASDVIEQVVRIFEGFDVRNGG